MIMLILLIYYIEIFVIYRLSREMIAISVLVINIEQSKI